jgi:23S rRNA (cytidine1920-2'-O)/16S rRNA (cytidine1409-2'-O)-methyltransferase
LNNRKGSKKDRIDRILVSQGFVESRQKAQALIMAGMVYCEGQRVEKSGQLVEADKKIILKEGPAYVSRGGLKLEEALTNWQISVEGMTAADLGASTGGFTDCLLQRGVKTVYAVDVDTRQIDWQLRNDPRVKLIEKNARYLESDDFPEKIDLITMDLSFISILKVLPAVRGILGKGMLLCLVKPQFEAGKGQVGKKGIVRDPVLHEEVLTRVISKAEKLGFRAVEVVGLSIKGQKGNREFFVLWTLDSRARNSAQVRRLIKEAVYEEKN